MAGQATPLRLAVKSPSSAVAARSGPSGNPRRVQRRNSRADGVENAHRPLARHAAPVAVTEVACRLETGRTHQIRVHLAAIGHPVVGDTRYGPPRFRPVPAFPGRLWLHAHRVRLPDGWEVLSPLPASLEAHLEVLRAGAAPEISEAEADQAHELGEIEGDAPAGEAPDTGAPAADAPEPSED